MYDLFEKVMDVVVRNWRNTLLSVSSDAARKMTGRAERVVSLLMRVTYHQSAIAQDLV